MSSLTDLEPKELWKHFYSLTQIPRPSKKEEKVIAFAREFGEKLGLETLVDEVGNVIIRKPAAEGFENRMGIILQAHLDMVPQKNSGTDHNFETDPIQTFIEDGWVKAKGTTLGADNGIGAAAAMAVLEANDLAHGPVEVLLTIDEETGMTGANGLKPGLLFGDILLNLDSEDEGELYVGCAGGVDTTGEFQIAPVAVAEGYKAYRISVTGLKGGHSGMDINLGRGNSNKIMNGLLCLAAKKYGLRLADIDGGSLRNAIPRESFATVVVPEAQASAFEKYVNEYAAIAYESFAKADGGLQITCEVADMPSNLLDEKTQQGLFEAVADCPNGVIAVNSDMQGVVDTSNNLAIVKRTGNTITLAALQRSAVDADKEVLAANIRDVFTKAGAKAYSDGAYPGWKPNVNSSILKTMKEVYQTTFGKVPEVKVIHAGLECGILGAVYPHWDMISFGPTIRHPHSPDEKVNIETVGLFWKYLVETLKNAPLKEQIA